MALCLNPDLRGPALFEREREGEVYPRGHQG